MGNRARRRERNMSAPFRPSIRKLRIKCSTISRRRTRRRAASQPLVAPARAMHGQEEDADAYSHGFVHRSDGEWICRICWDDKKLAKRSEPKNRLAHLRNKHFGIVPLGTPLFEELRHGVPEGAAAFAGAAVSTRASFELEAAEARPALVAIESTFTCGCMLAS